MSHPAPSQPHVSAYAAELAAEPPRTLGAWVTLFTAVRPRKYPQPHHEPDAAADETCRAL